MNVNPYIPAVRKAAQRGAATLRKMLGRSADPDVNLYRRLTPEDFERMAATYGRRAVADYIREMELKGMEG
jgi:hypothetical protein